MSRHHVVVPCAECRRKNRLRLDKLEGRATCGACHAALPSPANPIPLDDESFEDVVASASVPVVVDFWAAWCGPCRSFAPVFEEFAREAAGEVLAVKVDVDRARATAGRLGIQSIPTIAVFEGGREVRRTAGALSAGALRELVSGTSSKR